MAFFDDKKFLISHIRHSFVSCDDTGMCEAVMSGENLGYPASNDQDLDLSQSYDIVSDLDIGAHRRRSNTAVRLDKLKKEKKNQMKTKNIQWNNHSNNSNPSVEDFGEMFEKKEVKKNENRRSMLSEQLELCPLQPNNPFNEYAKFDGKAHSNGQSKKIHIFLTMLEGNAKNYPMEVSILSTAKVQDLIGLVCWQCINEKRKSDLWDDIDSYNLHIAEDDGEVDLDFPCLDPKDNISKFGFSVLALVESKSGSKESESSSTLTVSVNIPNEGVKKLVMEGSKITVQDVMEKLTRSLQGGSAKLQLKNYHLEKQKEPGIVANPSAVIQEINCYNFLLVKDTSAKDLKETEEWTLRNMTAMEAPLYQSYTVFMYHKLRSKSEVHLGISGDKIELDPIQQKASKFWNRSQKQKPVSYDMNSVAACELIDQRYPNRAVFRLHLQSSDQEFKHHDFESDTQTVDNILEKMSHILDMRSSSSRRDYLAIKEKKASFKSPFGSSSR